MTGGSISGSISGLVLAAGSGRRMGQPKAELQIGGVPLLQRSIRLLRAGGCDEVVAVVASTEVSAPGARAVVNPDAPSGMASSLRVGLDSVSGEMCVIILVDQHGITAGDVRAVIRAGRRGGELVVARRGGTHSHPVLVRRHLFQPLRQTLSGDHGARVFITAHPELVTEVDLPDVVGDLDTPEDLAAYRARPGL